MTHSKAFGLVLLSGLLAGAVGYVSAQETDAGGAVAKEEVLVDAAVTPAAPAAEPKVEDIQLDDIKVEAPKVEEVAVPAELPVVAPAVEAPAIEAPVVAAPVVEAPAVEAPVVAAPAVEAPAVEATAVEVPVVAAPAAEAPAVAEAPAPAVNLDATVEGAFKEAAAEGIPQPPPLPAAVPAVEAAPAVVVEAPAVEAVPAAEVPAVEAVVVPAAEVPAVEAVVAPAADVAMPAAEEVVPAAAEVVVPAADVAAPAVEAVPPAEDVPPAVNVDAAMGAATGEAPPAAPAEVVPVAAVVEAPVAVTSSGASSADLDAMVSREALRRQALEEHGMQSLKEARKALSRRNYKEAVKMYEESLKYIVDRTETRQTRQEARDGLGQSFYGWADDLRVQRDYVGARERAQLAFAHGHPQAQALIIRIDKEQANPPAPPKAPVTRRSQEPAYKDDVAKVDDYLRRGRQHLLLGELDAARSMFELVLTIDPENAEAIRLMHKSAQKKFDIASAEVSTTRTDMMADVRKTWNPRDYGVEATPLGARKPEAMATRQVLDDRQRILKKMEMIKVPEIDFRQANINDVIDFLQNASVEFDNSDDERKGVNIILNLGPKTGAGAPAAAPGAAADPFATTISDAGLSGGGEVPLISFTARYVSLLEALRIVCRVANLKYRIDGSVVMVVALNSAEQDIIVRMYDVLPTVEEKVTTMGTELGTGLQRGSGDFTPMTTAGVNVEGADWKSFFSEMGVKWPDGTSVRYVRTIGKLIVANTPDNLTTFEQILEVLNVVPSQIEIEARFVEVNQTDLTALGFEWLLTDDWEVATKKGQTGLPASDQRIVVGANAPGGFTRGMRFADETEFGAGNTVADDLLHVSSILTNPELSLIVHALEQKGNADLLSAPKVTAKSGGEATIKVVTEYIYPTEFTVTPITAANANGDTTIVGGVVEPGSFETREVGVILSVLPEVTPEGQMINLTMTPEVVSEPTWYEYGSVYTDQSGNEQRLNMQQPFFKTRTVSTSIQVYNGATVVMGGMITENRTEVDDKVPLLGDIPIIGRLFRSKYDSSDKRNLLIFVTARLVDPAGRQLKGKTIEPPAGLQGIMPMAGAGVTQP